MKKFFNRLISAASFVCVFLSLNIANATFDVEFYNVGQGHCCVAKTAKNGIIIVDAGSSSTIGVDQVNINKKKKIGLNLQLANHIFSSIKGELKSSNEKKLNFIITHADKDHLNLATSIVRQVIRECKNISIKFILGGPESDYNKTEAKEVRDLLKKCKIPHAYGTEFTKNTLSLLWEPPLKVAFETSDTESVEFLSVKSEAKTQAQTADIKNASSIVVKLNGEGCSVMITGDKTKSEIMELIQFYDKENKQEALKADVLLATHHGSEEDFSPLWMKMVNPSYLVVSAGTSSFFHPRPEAICSESVLSNLRPVNNLPWHPIRSYGNLSSIQTKHLDRLIPICSGKDDNYRSTPYSYSMTNAGIYVTADQGMVKFKFSNKQVTARPTKQKGRFSFEEALERFLTSRSNEWSALVVHPPSTHTHFV